jgi:hypothetical protein
MTAARDIVRAPHLRTALPPNYNGGMKGIRLAPRRPRRALQCVADGYALERTSTPLAATASAREAQDVRT